MKLLDFLLWGYVKNLVYSIYIRDLNRRSKKAIDAAAAPITLKVLARSWEELHGLTIGAYTKAC